MKTIVIISIHQKSYNSFCGKDYNGYLNFDNQELANNFINENKLAISETYSDNELNFTLIYLETLEYNKRLEWAKENFIEGFSKEQSMYWDKQDRLENEKRKSEGYVRHGDDSDLKGKLNNTLTEQVLNYINQKGVFGYLGHSARMLKHDEIIENTFSILEFKLDNENLNKWECLGSWLTSSDARHFMDSIEDEEINIFEERIKENALDIIKLGYIYNLEEHGGECMQIQKDY